MGIPFTTAFLKLTSQTTLESQSSGAISPFKLQHIVISMTHILLTHPLISAVGALLPQSEINPTNARDE